VIDTINMTANTHLKYNSNKCVLLKEKI